MKYNNKNNIQKILHEFSCIIKFIKRVGEKYKVPSILSVFPNEFNKFNNTQGMQSRDSCVQREISSSITLLHTGIIKVQVRS